MHRLFNRFVDKVTGPLERPDTFAQNDRRLVQEIKKLWDDFRGTSIPEKAKNEVFFNCLKIFCQVMASPEETDEVIQALGDVRSFGFVVSRFFVEEIDKICVGKEKRLTAENAISFLSVGPEENSGAGATLLNALELFVSAELDSDGLIDGGALPTLVKIFHAFMFFQKNSVLNSSNDRNIIKSNLNKMEYLDDDKENNSSELSYSPWTDETRRLMVQASVEGILVGLSQHDGAAACLADADALQLLFHMIGADGTSDSSFSDNVGIIQSKSFTTSTPESIQQRTRALKILTMVLENDNGGVAEYIRDHKLLEVLLVVIIRFDVDTCDSQLTISVVGLLLLIMKLSYKSNSEKIHLKEDFKNLRGYFWLGQLAYKLTFTSENTGKSPKSAFSPISPAFWNSNSLPHSEPLHPSARFPYSVSTSSLPPSNSSSLPPIHHSPSFKSPNLPDSFPGFAQDDWQTNDPWQRRDASGYDPLPTPSKVRAKSGPLTKGVHDPYFNPEETHTKHFPDDTATHFRLKSARPPDIPQEALQEPQLSPVPPALLKLLDLLVSFSMVGDSQAKLIKPLASEQSAKPFPKSASTDTGVEIAPATHSTHIESSPLTVKDLEAVQLLQDIFQHSNQVSIQISILERFQSLLAGHPENYSIIKDLKIVPMFIRGINQYPTLLQEQLLKLLEYTVIAVSVVPEQELLALVCEIQKHISPTMARATLSFFIKILSFDTKFKDVFREVGVLDILVDDLAKCSPPASTIINNGISKASHRTNSSASDADTSSSFNSQAIPPLTLDVPFRSRNNVLRRTSTADASKLASRRNISTGAIPDATGANASSSCFFGNEFSRSLAWECLLAMLPRSSENQRVFRLKKGFESMLPLLACKIQRAGVLNTLHVLIIEDSASSNSEEFALVLQAVRRGNVSNLSGKSFRLDFQANREILWSIWRMLGSSPFLQELFAKVDGYQLTLSMLNSLKNSENSVLDSISGKSLTNPIPAPPVRLSLDTKSTSKSLESAQNTPGASPLRSPSNSATSPPPLSLDIEMKSVGSSESLADLSSSGYTGTSPKDSSALPTTESSLNTLSPSTPLYHSAPLFKHASGVPRSQSHSSMTQNPTPVPVDSSLLNKMELVEALFLVILRATKDNPSNRIVLREKLHVDAIKKTIPATGLLTPPFEEKIINLLFDLSTETVRQPSGMTDLNDNEPPFTLVQPFHQRRGFQSENSFEDQYHRTEDQFKAEFDCAEYVRWLEERLEMEKERNDIGYHSCVFNASAVQIILEIVSSLSLGMQLQILGTVFKLALISPRNLESLTSIGAIGIILDSMKSHLTHPKSPLVLMGFHIIELLGTFRLSSSELHAIMAYMRKNKESIPMDISHRFLSLMERMANPIKPEFKHLSLSSFIHFDFSRMGHSCIQIPLGDRTWPPQNGYTLSCWIKFQGLRKKSDPAFLSEDEGFPYSRSSDSNSFNENLFPVNQKYILRLFSISAIDEHPSTEILINAYGNVVLVTGQSSKLIFNEVSLNDGVWYHLVLVHNKPVALSGIFHSSPASLYIDGSLGQNGKLGYSAPSPGKPQQIIIGSSQEYSNILPLSFELGPTYLFEETLSSASIFFLYLFGRGYRGVFQDSDLPRFIPLEACNGRNMMIVQDLNQELNAVGGLPPGFWEFASEENTVYGSQFKDSTHVCWNSNAHPGQVMHNLTSKKMIFKIDGTTAETCPPCLARSLVNTVDALSSAASFGSIPQLMDMVGDIQICTPSSFSQNLRKIGGIAVVLTMIEISENHYKLYLSLSLLLNCLFNNPGNAIDMSRIRGYHLLALFLYQKTSFFGSDCLETILKIAGLEMTEMEIKQFGLKDSLISQRSLDAAKISPTIKLTKPPISSPFFLFDSGVSGKNMMDETEQEKEDGKFNTLVLINENMVKDVLLDWTIWVKAKTDIQIKLLDFFENSLHKNRFCYHNTIFLRRIKAVQLLLVVLQRGDVEVVVLEKLSKFLGLLLENSFDPAELKMVSDFIVMTFKPSREILLSQEKLRESMNEESVNNLEMEKDEKGRNEKNDLEFTETSDREREKPGDDKGMDILEMSEKISERNSNLVNYPKSFSILSNKIVASVPRKGGRESYGMHVIIRNILLEMLVRLQLNIHSDERYDVWHRLVSTKVINYLLDEEVHATTIRWVIVLLGGCLSAPSAFALRFKISGGYQELQHVLSTFSEEPEIYFLLIAIMYSQPVYPRLKQVRLLDFYGLLSLKAEGEELQFVELLDSIVSMFKLAVQKNPKIVSSIAGTLTAEGEQMLSASEALRVLVEAQFGKQGILNRDTKQGSFRSNSSRQKSHPMPSAASLPLQGGLAVGSNLAMGLLRFMVDASKACGGLSSACRRQEFLESCTELYFLCVRSALSHHVKSKSVDENGFLALMSGNPVDQGKSTPYKQNLDPKSLRPSTSGATLTPSSVSSPREMTQASSWDYASPANMLNWLSGPKEHREDGSGKRHALSPSMSGEGLDEAMLIDESITSDMLLRVHSGSLSGIAPSVCATATLDLLAESLAGALLEQTKGTQLVEVMLDAVSLELSTDTALVFQGLCLVRLMSVMERRLVHEMQVETLDRTKWTANLESLSTLLVDRAYLGAFAEPGATRRVLEFLLAMLRLANLDGRVEEAQPQGKSLLMLQRDKSKALEPFVHVLLKNVNRMVMFSFLPPLLAGLSQEQARLNSSGNSTYNDPQWEPSNMDRTLKSADALQLILDNRKVALCPSNNDPEFMCCLVHNLSEMLWDESKESVRDVVMEMWKLLLSVRYKELDELLSFRNSKGHTIDVLRGGFDKLRHGTREFYKWLKIAEDDVQTVLDQHASPEWMEFMSSATKFPLTKLKPLEARRRKEMARRSKDIGKALAKHFTQRSSRLLSLENVRHAIAIELRIRRHDKYGWILHAEREWQSFLLQLVHERGIWPIWGGYESENLVQWELCDTEGPFRMRKKLSRCRVRVDLSTSKGIVYPGKELSGEEKFRMISNQVLEMVHSRSSNSNSLSASPLSGNSPLADNGREDPEFFHQFSVGSSAMSSSTHSKPLGTLNLLDESEPPSRSSIDSGTSTLRGFSFSSKSTEDGSSVDRERDKEVEVGKNREFERDNGRDADRMKPGHRSSLSFDLDAIDLLEERGQLRKVKTGNETIHEEKEIVKKKSLEEPDVDEGEKESSLNLIQEGLSEMEDDGEHLIRPYLEPTEKIKFRFNCERVVGLDKRDGIFLIGEICLYVIENYYLDQSGRICEKNEGEISVLDQALGVDISNASNATDAELYGGWKETASAWRDSHSWGSTGESFDQAESSKNQNPGGSAPGRSLLHECRTWKLDDVNEILKRRYQLRPVAIELFSMSGVNDLLVFHINERDIVLKRLHAMGLPRNSMLDTTISGAASDPSEQGRMFKIMAKSFTKRWQDWEISTFQYLMHLNTLAGRGYNDLTQYPVFPWVVSDYESEELDLTQPQSFRDLSKPMGCLSPQREAEFKKRYESWDDPEIPKFHYGSHYSSAGIVLYFLIRLPPFSSENLKLQGGHFDHADRLFSNISETWRSASTGHTADVKELTPEFYYMPKFLENRFHLDLGSKQSGEKVEDVLLPPWANGSAREFIRKHREALESDYVSDHIHDWIDLIFGYKQKNQAAIDATNVFFYLTYEGAVDIDAIRDTSAKKSILAQINSFGQTPRQLFLRPHPKRKPKPKAPIYHALRLCDALIPTDLNTMLSPVTQFIYIKDRIGLLYGQSLMKPPMYDKYLSWGFSDGSLRVFEQLTDKLISMHEAVHDDGPIQCVDVSRDGNIFATGGKDGIVAVWRYPLDSFKSQVKKLTLMRMLCAHKNTVTSLAISQPWMVLVSGSEDHTVIIWDLNSLEFIRQLSEFSSPVSAVKVNETTGDIVTAAGPVLAVWSINGDCLAIVNSSTRSSESITCVTMPMLSDWMDTGWYITGHKNGSIKIWTMEKSQDPQVPLPKRHMSVSHRPKLKAVANAITSTLSTYNQVSGSSSNNSVGPVSGNNFSHPGGNGGNPLSHAPSTISVVDLRAIAEEVIAENAKSGNLTKSFVPRKTPEWQLALRKELVWHTDPISALFLTTDLKSLYSGDNAGKVTQWALPEENLKEHLQRNFMNNPPICSVCRKKFAGLERKYFCSNCGKMVCGKCCSGKLALHDLGYFSPVKVCAECYDYRVAMAAKASGMKKMNSLSPSPSLTNTSPSPVPSSPMANSQRHSQRNSSSSTPSSRQMPKAPYPNSVSPS